MGEIAKQRLRMNHAGRAVRMSADDKNKEPHHDRHADSRLT
jgi:hypothetical protein